MSESYSGGTLGGLTLTNSFDPFLRRSGLGLNTQPAALNYSYTYDSASRLQRVTDVRSGSSATYKYLASSPLVEQIFFTNNGALRMSSTRQHDYLNRLTRISSADGQQSPINSYGYQLNGANQRTATTNADSSRWVYDVLGQVTSGRRYWSDSSPVAGQQFEYSFDDIGNRKSAGSGGNEFGANLRYQTYSANSLNQYVSRTVPGVVQVLGSANASAAVSLWSSAGAYGPTARKGAYFWGEVLADNSAGPLWLGLTNVAALKNGSSPDILSCGSGNVFVPKLDFIHLLGIAQQFRKVVDELRSSFSAVSSLPRQRNILPQFSAHTGQRIGKSGLAFGIPSCRTSAQSARRTPVQLVGQ